MATVKKDKKKVIIPICIVLVAAIAGGSVFAVTRANSGKEVELSTIAAGDICESVSLTGEVTAGTTKEYKVGTVATVKEVFVKLGDKVKKDDVLATFDVTKLDEQIATLQSSYIDALSNYNKSLSTYKTAKSNAKRLEKEIAELEKKVKKLEKKASAASTTKKKTTTKTKPTSNTTRPNITIPTTTTTTTVPSTTESTTETTTTTTTTTKPLSPEETVGNLVEQITQLNETLTKLTEDIETLAKMTEIIADTMTELLSKGVTDSNVIAQAVGEAVRQAINEGVVDAAKLIVDSDIAVRMVEAAVAAIDFQGITDAALNSTNVSLTAAQIQLASKYAQYEIFSIQANDTVVKSQKSALDATKKALDTLKEQKAEMEQGWKAAFDGTITAVDIEPGGQTTLVTAGITLENLDSMTATVSLSEYDVHKVKVGMPATVTTAYGSYEGEVVSIAPTATGGSSLSFLDNVGSMAGISGLSSLTDKGAGVECQISIKETDENIIVGFDANVEIMTGEYLGVTMVPVESVKLEKTGSYVYLYNEEDSTVTKVQIETGATNDSHYEVKSGLNVGDQIITAPETTYEEDTFKVKIKK